MRAEKQIGELKVCDGNKAAAHAVKLCKPDVIAVFPITPQTGVIEQLCSFQAQGLLGAEIVEVEGENSAMGVVVGASAAGGRVFTATSSMGLDFMYDTYLMAAGLRLPVVMVNVSREQSPPTGPTAGEQDIMHVRDAGWVQIHTETCQEILDTIIMAYRLAEDPEVLLPVTVNYDGYYLSYLSEGIRIPPQEAVDRFLAPLAPVKRPVLVGADAPVIFGIATVLTETWSECRYKHQDALERVKEKLEEVEKEFGDIFGRSYGGLIEEYRTEDAEIVLVSLGSHTGTARTVIDAKRDEGVKVGLVKVRLFRPFPRERLREALQDKKAIGVLDRSVCFGWRGGHLFVELKAALDDAGRYIPMVDFIGGLGGADITKAHIARAIELTGQAGKGNDTPEVVWLSLE